MKSSKYNFSISLTRVCVDPTPTVKHLTTHFETDPKCRNKEIIIIKRQLITALKSHYIEMQL